MKMILRMIAAMLVAGAVIFWVAAVKFSIVIFASKAVPCELSM